MPSEDDFGHPNWSEVPRDLTDPARAAAFEALGEVNQEYQHFMKMVEALDDPRALPGMQASLGRLMGYLNNPNTRALFTDEGVQRILELTKYFPAGMAHEAFTGGAQGGRSTPSPFPPSSTGRPGPNLNDPMLTPGAIAPNVDPPDVMTTGTLGPQPQRTPTRGLLPSSSQQLPPLTGGQTVAPRPRLTAPLPSGGQPLSPLTPRPSMPPGLPQPGTGRPDLQWPPPTPREPFPPDVPRMTQRPQGPPRFDLERALPRPASPPVLPRIEGGLDQLPAPPPGMPGYTSEESITVRPEDPGGVTVQPPVDISVPEITPVNPEWDRIKRNTRGGWEANNYQLPEEQRERVDHNVENILGGNVSYQVRQAVTNWLESQIYVESRGRSQAESKKDAIGLMQVISDEALADVVDSPYWDAEMQADWDALGTGLTFPTDLTGAELKDWMNVQHPGYRKRIDDALLANPDFSLEVGTNYLKVLAKKPSSAYNFQNAPSPLVATILAYHQGGSTVRKWIDSGAAGDMQRNPETLAFDGIDTSDHSIIGPEGWDYVHNVMNQINPAEEAIINDLIRNQWRYR